MTDDPKTQRFRILLSPSEVARIDTWGSDHHVRSRADAMRRLVNKGLQAPAIALLARRLLESVLRAEVSDSDSADGETLLKMQGAVEVIWRDFLAAIGEPLPPADDDPVAFLSKKKNPPFDNPQAAIERLNRIIHGA